MPRGAGRGAVKARVAALNDVHGLMASAPEDLRAQPRGLTIAALVARASAFKIREDELDDPQVAIKAALRAIARRIRTLDAEVTLADRRIAPAVTRLAPATSAGRTDPHRLNRDGDWDANSDAPGPA